MVQCYPPPLSGRLLAGVKWNPVRQRVDTLHARGDQLILGTLIFSTLLFLFPTTLVYYFVFSLVSGRLRRIMRKFGIVP